MAVSFDRVISVDVCRICFESMVDSEAVAHQGANGDKHAWHIACIRDYIERSGNPYCPGCQILTDKNFFFSKRKLVMIQLNSIKDKVFAAIENAVGPLAVGGVAMMVGGVVLGEPINDVTVTVIKIVAMLLTFAIILEIIGR